VNDCPPKALIIDFGGVLTTDLFASMRAFAEGEGLERDALVRLVTVDPDGKELLAALERGDIVQRAFEREIGLRLGVSDENLEARIMADLRPNELMLSTVAEIRSAGYRVAILSNTWGLEPYSVYDGYDLSARCDVLIYSEQVRLRKPDPRIFRLTADRLGVAPHGCVFVDDVAHNLGPARQMGMTVVRHIETGTTVHVLRREFPKVAHTRSVVPTHDAMPLN
jgi:epoxide hydrolase-like predicted phosphatase